MMPLVIEQSYCFGVSKIQITSSWWIILSIWNVEVSICEDVIWNERFTADQRYIKDVLVRRHSHMYLFVLW